MRNGVMAAIFFLVSILSFSQTAGPQGPRGFTGARGPAGTITIGTVTQGAPDSLPVVSNVGTASEARLNITIPRGSQVFSGTGVPTTVGLNGDWYIRTDTACMYGPKAAGSWPGTCLSLLTTISIAGTTAVTPAAGPSVTNIGTAFNANLQFSLPRARNFSIGSVTTTAPGGVATASTTTDVNGDVSLSFGIPSGTNGTTTTTGATGDYDVTGRFSAKEAIFGLDATKFQTLGVDMCGAINAAWTYAVGKGWKAAIVNARGFHGNQACSSWMFANVPYTPGQACKFDAVLLLGDEVVQTDVSQIVPCNSSLIGTANNNISAGATTIRPTPAYYAITPAPYGIVQMGYAGSTWSGGTPPEGARIEHIFINGNPTTGTNAAPTTCLINQYSQENTSGEFLAMDGCITAFSRQMDPSSSIFGALNDGPWRNIHVNFNGIPTAMNAQARCINNGTDRLGLGPTRGIEDVSCNIQGLTTQPLEAVRASGTGFILKHAHFEGFRENVVLGEDFTTTGFMLEDVTNVSFAAPFTTVGNVRAATGHTVNGYMNGISGVNPSFTDDTSVTTQTANPLYDYIFPPTAAAGTVVNTHSTSYALTAGDNNSIHGFTAYGTTATVTLPATVAAGWTATVLNYSPTGTLVVDPNGHFMNGSTSTVTLPAGESFAYFYTNGTNFYVRFGALPPAAGTTTTPVTTHSASYTLLAADTGTIHTFAAYGATATATLPTAPPSGWTVRIINYNATGALTIDPAGQFMNGSTTSVVIPAGESFVRLYSNGTNFYGEFGTTTPVAPNAYWTDTTIAANYTVLSTDSNKSISVGCTGDCTVTLPNPVPSATFHVRIINSQGSTTTPSLVTVSRNGILMNGGAKDITLSYGQTVEVWSNGGATIYRSETIQPFTYSTMGGTAAAPVILGWPTKQKITLTANATPTFAIGPEGFCTRLYIFENGTGGFTWTWPANVRGGMTIVTTANARNAQEFCYDIGGAFWEASGPGVSY